MNILDFLSCLHFYCNLLKKIKTVEIKSMNARLLRTSVENHMVIYLRTEIHAYVAILIFN